MCLYKHKFVEKCTKINDFSHSLLKMVNRSESLMFAIRSSSIIKRVFWVSTALPDSAWTCSFFFFKQL